MEKSSAVLGFPLETSAGMDADHHTICKFRDRSDPNFRKVKSILKTWASELTDTGMLTPSTSIFTIHKASISSNIEEHLASDRPCFVNDTNVFR